MLEIATVDHVAELAKLGLRPDERDVLRAQLFRILEYVDQLAELDAVADPVDPVRPPQGSRPAALRPDEIEGSLSPGEALANATGTRRGQFTVPPLFG